MGLLRNLASIAACITVPVLGADWPCWRGPDGLGVSPEKNLPVSWSKETNLLWTAEIPGKGVSSPIVVGKRVYLTTQMPDTGLHALAMDSSNGKLLWDILLFRFASRIVIM